MMSNLSCIIPLDCVKQLTDIKKSNQLIFFTDYNGAPYNGRIKCRCALNGDELIFGIELFDEIRNGTNGTFNDIDLFYCKDECGILVYQSFRYIEIDEDTGLVCKHEVKEIDEKDGEFAVNESVMVNIKTKQMKGNIIRSGTINDIFCYAVTLDEDPSSNNISSCIVLGRDVSKLPSANSEHYKIMRYNLDPGDNRGIQGNLNSCYLDTSLFAIFTFNMFLDNLILDECTDTNIKELQTILKTEIVYPLRKNGYVGYVTMSKFRDKLNILSPKKGFVINERDPEEFLEQLFKLLTPKKYLLKTTPLQNMDNVQNCFLTQIFYQSIPDKSNIDLKDMLTLSFLEFEMLILKPPKCMILQLPRDGREMKQFKRVSIPSKLDITPFVINSIKECKDCSTRTVDLYFCKTCSLASLKLSYCCKEHKLNCIHEKIAMPHCEPPYYGSVKLDLVSILCIEKTHYVAFVKTNCINEKWLYYNSMEKIENGIFTPVVRDTNLAHYFANGSKISSNYDQDVDRIEKYAFICVYKNPCMEFYQSDFNSEK